MVRKGSPKRRKHRKEKVSVGTGLGVWREGAVCACTHPRAELQLSVKILCRAVYTPGALSGPPPKLSLS